VKGHVRKRGSSWPVVVYAGRSRDRRRQYVYESVRGSRRDADRRLAELVAGVSNGRRLAPTQVTIAELAHEWLATSTAELSPTTRRGYRRFLDARILPVVGNTRLTDLTTRELACSRAGWTAR
jgi:integrase-like protein